MYRPHVRNTVTTEDKLAEAAKLRDQLHREIIESKKLCSYEPHECKQLRFDNYNFCQRHLLKDERAPYKQCSYIYNITGKKCHMPAPKSDNKLGYCIEHIKKAAVSKYRSTQKVKPIESAETVLNSLTHYVKPLVRQRTRSANSDLHDLVKTPYRKRTTSGTSVTSEKEEGRITPDDPETKLITRSLSPFRSIDAMKINASCSEILEYASESDSDIEPTVFGSTWSTVNGESSENESVDSENEDPLKHAEIYTAEEVCSITRDKLIRLQDLYTKEFSFLQLELRDKRKKYLQSLKKEKETYASIHNQVRDNPHEMKLYNKLKALNNYHKRSGIEAILQKKVYELRAKVTEGIQHKQSSFVKCIFTEGGVKCGERSLPMARHCLKHVLSDTQQVLFRACGVTRADVTCHEPVPDVFPGQACIYHMDVPQLKSYTYMKNEDTDLDDSAESIDVISGTNIPIESLSEQSQLNSYNRYSVNEFSSNDVLNETSVRIVTDLFQPQVDNMRVLDDETIEQVDKVQDLIDENVDNCCTSNNIEENFVSVNQCNILNNVYDKNDSTE